MADRCVVLDSTVSIQVSQYEEAIPRRIDRTARVDYYPAHTNRELSQRRCHMTTNSRNKSASWMIPATL